MMMPQQPSLESVVAAFIFAAMVLTVAMLLAGCAIPIPPSGPDLGKYGTVRIGVTYESSSATAPYFLTTQPSTNSFK
jgi:hypothetical protein